MFKRKLVPNSCCPICENEEETICHALWICVAASDVGLKLTAPCTSGGARKLLFCLWGEISYRLSVKHTEEMAAIFK